MAIDMKDIIAEKFSEIAKYKTIDKISVTGLASACNISRQAFYYHFQDVMDVAVWLLKKRLRSMLEYSLEAAATEEAIRRFVACFSENREMFRKRVDSQMHQQFELLIQQEIRAFLKEIAVRMACPLPYADFEVVLDFCAGGMYAMLLSRTGESEETDLWLTRQLSRLISREFTRLPA